VQWTNNSQSVLGVPVDMVQSAARGDEDPDNVAQIAKTYATRRLQISGIPALMITGFTAMALTILTILGFAQRLEWAQALSILLVPQSLVFWRYRHTARQVLAAHSALDCITVLYRHRWVTQVIGAVSIMAAAIWGMLHNIAHGLI
jgi:hypothetical protein